MSACRRRFRGQTGIERFMGTRCEHGVSYAEDCPDCIVIWEADERDDGTQANPDQSAT